MTGILLIIGNRNDKDISSELFKAFEQQRISLILTINGKVVCSFHNPAVTKSFTMAAEMIELVVNSANCSFSKGTNQVLSDFVAGSQ
jgi:hypothetical protein